MDGAVNDLRRRRLLAVDAAANYVLGVPLLVAPGQTARALALPDTRDGFYPRVLGGVLTGIATALVLEGQRHGNDLVGLGTGGAMAINMLGGSVTACWLLSPGAKALPRRGRALLWGIALSVLGIGAAEAWREQREGFRIVAHPRGAIRDRT